MTLSDLLTLLRARKGGVFYSDVADAVEIPVLRIVRAERTLSVPDLTPDELGRLAEYLDAPLEELERARLVNRGDLTAYLAACEKEKRSADLTLVGEARVSGPVSWRDRHAVGLAQPDGTTIVVYRSNIDRWNE